MASLRMLSWNHIMEWLKEMELLKCAARQGLTGAFNPL